MRIGLAEDREAQSLLVPERGNQSSGRLSVRRCPQPRDGAPTPAIPSPIDFVEHVFGRLVEGCESRREHPRERVVRKPYQGRTQHRGVGNPIVEQTEAERGIDVVRRRLEKKPPRVADRVGNAAKTEKSFDEILLGGRAKENGDVVVPGRPRRGTVGYAESAYGFGYVAGDRVARDSSSPNAASAAVSSAAVSSARCLKR